jgi:hypothetical protein
MSKKNHRSGGKFRGSHTTLIDAAAEVVDYAVDRPEVTGVSLCFIKTGLPPANGQKRIKISEEGGAVLLQVRGNTSQQLVMIFSDDFQATKLAIARHARSQGLSLSFGK